ncbi:MAG TPA: hypothetical protein VNN06_08890, partial [Ramlibacter sp.]|nr:hypothetical protein [Ramlibacter sp.]
MKPGTAVPARPLLALAAAVLAAHLFLFRAVPGPVRVSPVPAAQPFTIRNVAARPQPSAAAAPAPQPVQQGPERADPPARRAAPARQPRDARVTASVRVNAP